jgi:hypothetical protein
MKDIREGTRRKLVTENGQQYIQEKTTTLVGTYKIKKTDIERAKQLKQENPHLPSTVEEIAIVLSALEKWNVSHESGEEGNVSSLALGNVTSTTQTAEEIGSSLSVRDQEELERWTQLVAEREKTVTVTPEDLESATRMKRECPDEYQESVEWIARTLAAVRDTPGPYFEVKQEEVN